MHEDSQVIRNGRHFMGIGRHEALTEYCYFGRCGWLSSCEVPSLEERVCTDAHRLCMICSSLTSGKLGTDKAFCFLHH